MVRPQVGFVVPLIPKRTLRDWVVVVGLWVATICAFALGAVSDARWTIEVPRFAFVAFACVVQWPLRLRYWISVAVWTALLAVYWAGLAPRIGGRPSISMFLTSGRRSEFFLDQLRRAYDTMPDTDPQLMLSMEIFAAAGVETDKRAHFLACVSAFEPLAAEQPLGSDVSEFVGRCVRRLHEELPDESSVRSALKDRLRRLRKRAHSTSDQRRIYARRLNQRLLDEDEGARNDGGLELKSACR
jgi:hypothetical protein